MEPGSATEAPDLHGAIPRLTREQVAALGLVFESDETVGRPACGYRRRERSHISDDIADEEQS